MPPLCDSPMISQRKVDPVFLVQGYMLDSFGVDHCAADLLQEPAGPVRN
jgi:hypothetical protein